MNAWLGIRRSMLVLAGALAVLAVAASSVGTARAATEPSDYVVAQVPIRLGGGTTVPFTALDILLCSTVNTTCPERAIDAVSFVGVTTSSIGTTAWRDAPIPASSLLRLS